MKKRRLTEQIKKRHQQNMKIVFREHRIPFLVFNLLRLLTVGVFVRQIMLENYESAFFCILTVLLLYIPSWIQMTLPVVFPPALEITAFCFTFAAEILGEVDAFYVRVPGWDTMLHTINGFICAAIGYSLITILNKNPKIAFELSPFFVALMAFCFSMTIGVLWEFVEFSVDWIFHTDAQKDTVIYAIHSVALDSSLKNHVVTIDNISTVLINGNEIGINGYLDIGLIDTMKDLIVNFVGAVVFCMIGFCCSKGKRFWKSVVRGFIPRQREQEKNTEISS